MCQSTSLILRCEPVLTPLPFLDALVAQETVQVSGLHPQSLGNLRHRQAFVVTLVFALQGMPYNALRLIHHVVIRHQQVSDSPTHQILILMFLFHIL